MAHENPGPVVWGAVTSGFIVLARYVMDGLGLDFQKDFEPILHKSEAAFGQRLEPTRESTLANRLAAAPSRDLMHPGVLKYMREARWLNCSSATHEMDT